MHKKDLKSFQNLLQTKSTALLFLRKFRRAKFGGGGWLQSYLVDIQIIISY